jgi:hypothetical protein
MSKVSRIRTLIFAVLIILVTFLIAENLYVKVQSARLRKEPKFYAATIVFLKAGESVAKLSSQAGWYLVQTAGGIKGWLHSSAVQSKKVDLVTMDKSLKAKASAEEVALASKGFNEQVEQEYKARHKDISFAWVDRMLTIKVSPEQLRKFLKEGKLAEFGGGI